MDVLGVSEEYLDANGRSLRSFRMWTGWIKLVVACMFENNNIPFWIVDTYQTGERIRMRGLPFPDGINSQRTGLVVWDDEDPRYVWFTASPTHSCLRGYRVLLPERWQSNDKLKALYVHIKLKTK